MKQREQIDAHTGGLLSPLVHVVSCGKPTGKRARVRVAVKQEQAVKAANVCISDGMNKRSGRKPNGSLSAQWGKGGYLVNSKLR